MQPCQHPAVWTAKELRSRPDWLRTWTSDEITELNQLASAVSADAAAIESMGPLRADESPRLFAKMQQVRHDLEHGCGATRIQGFPIDQYEERQAAALFWQLMATVGTAVPQTATGELLFRVQDEGHTPDHPKARGPSSNKSLSFHTDRCDVISFLCYRQADEGGENQLISSMALFNYILRNRPRLLDRLLEPYVYQRHNVDPGNENAFYHQPVFSFCDGHFAANLLRVLIERAYSTDAIGPMPEEKRAALDYLEEIAELPELKVAFRQQPGDMVLLNNFVTLHRRSAFQDSASAGSGRLLFRVWLAVPNSRPLDPSFSSSYGETGAGQVRGGMRQLSS